MAASSADPDAPHPQQALVVPAAVTFAVVRGSDDDGDVTQGRPPAVRDEHGRLPVGALCLAVDHAVGVVLAAALTADQRMVTSHMHLELVRVADTETARARGELVHVGGGGALARTTITDDAGALVALATARFAVFPADALQGGMVGAVPAGSAAAGTAGAGADAAGSPGRAAPDVVRHELTAGAPVHELLATEVLHADGASVRLRVVASPQLANERGGLHGGVGALIGERACALALRSARPDGAPMRPVELRVVFVRPVPAVGEPLECTAEVVHAGRSLAVTRAVLYTPDGRVAVTVDAAHAP